MHKKEWELPENGVISIEEYLNKRKKRQKDSDSIKSEELIPFEIYLSSSLSWS